MRYLSTLLLALAPLLVSIRAHELELAPSPAALSARALAKRATIYSYGHKYTVGALSKRVLYQSSGVFALGGCNKKYKINQCYMMYLGASGMAQTATASNSNLDDITALAAVDDNDLGSYYAVFPDKFGFMDYADGTFEKRSMMPSDPAEVAALVRRATATCGAGGSTKTTTPARPTATKPSVPNRQRIEVYSWPGARITTSWKYVWKSHLVSGTSVTTNFFHLWQVLRRDKCGGPVMALDAIVDSKTKKQVVGIYDPIRGCNNCASVPLNRWVDRTIQHTLYITYGANGNATYTAAYVDSPSKPILTYRARGDMGAQASYKYGMYRLITKGQKEARSFVGDYHAKQLHPGDYQPKW